MPLEINLLSLLHTVVPFVTKLKVLKVQNEIIKVFLSRCCLVGVNDGMFHCLTKAAIQAAKLAFPTASALRHLRRGAAFTCVSY